jgi:plasmid stabilization system protein ParE
VREGLRLLKEQDEIRVRWREQIERQAYRLTERAEADVEAIADFIAADRIDAAMKVVLALDEAFVLLASRPGVGHAVTI